MKQFIKRRWPLLFGVLGIALLLGFLYHKDFRITYAPELENSWDAISACAAWAGAIGTIAVLWYNHRSIRLAQYSVQQAINLQLYEKRLALYTDLSKSDAFKESPIELKIVYSEIIYNSHKQIVDLCNQKAELINDLYILATFTDSRVDPCWNICEAEFEKYIRHLDLCIKRCDGQQKKSLMQHKIKSLEIQDKIKKKYNFLETSMRMVLNNSIGKDS